MDVREAGIRYWLEPIPPERMPALATEWLAAGIGGDAVVMAASSDFMDSRDIRDRFIGALKEVDVWLPSADDAELALIEYTATAIAQDENQLEEQAQSLRRLLGVDEAIPYGSFPRPYEDVVVMLWVYGTEAFEEAGGLSRLRQAVREIVEPSPSS
jgi:hypothetical protein